MTTSLVNSQIQSTTDAQFRAWSSQVSAQLAAVGLTKTADTGQIDFTTVLRPTVANTAAGYEIWRFNDTLQATRPIFFKVEYGQGTTVATFPSMWLTVGTGSDGAGNITGVLFPRTAFGRVIAPSASAVNSYACYSAALGHFSFVGWVGGNTGTVPSAMLAFAICRPVDDAGVPVDEGIAVYYGASTALNWFAWSFINGAQLAIGSNNYAFIPGAIVSSTVGTEIQLFRHYQPTPRVRNTPGMFTYITSEISGGGSFTATILGTLRTFMPMGNGLTNTSSTNNVIYVLATLWE